MADMLDGFRDIYEDFYGMTDGKERKKAINDRIRAAEEKGGSSSAAGMAPVVETEVVVEEQVEETPAEIPAEESENSEI